MGRWGRILELAFLEKTKTVSFGKGLFRTLFSTKNKCVEGYNKELLNSFAPNENVRIHWNLITFRAAKLEHVLLNEGNLFSSFVIILFNIRARKLK